MRQCGGDVTEEDTVESLMERGLRGPAATELIAFRDHLQHHYVRKDNKSRHQLVPVTGCIFCVRAERGRGR